MAKTNIIYCDRLNCNDNTNGCCDREVVLIGQSGNCDSFLPKEDEDKEYLRDPDKERDIKEDE